MPPRPTEESEHANETRPDEERVKLEYQRRVPPLGDLCRETEYVLKKRLGEAGIRFASVTSRVKDLDSLLEKIEHKGYDDPFSQVTDLAGARVVCLYRSDFEAIQELILEEFEVVEVEDKIQQQGVTEFGYAGVNYLVRVAQKYSGARYDHLKGLICEVQVRTVLHDAWAIISHHLEYKQESAVPTELRRRLHAVSALFEIADREFDGLRNERDAYIERIRDEAGAAEIANFLARELNLDSLREYVQWKFSDLPAEGSKNGLAVTLEGLTDGDCKTLADIDSLIERTMRGLNLLRNNHPASFDSADLLLDAALALTSDTWGTASQRWINRKHLVQAAKAIGDVAGVKVPPPLPPSSGPDTNS